MSDNFAPRQEEDGRFERPCQNEGCENILRTNNPRARYCSLVCRKQARDRRYYASHANEVKARVVATRRAKRQREANRLDQESDIYPDSPAVNAWG